MWDRFLRIRICCALAVAAICAGCITTIGDVGAGAANYVDLSEPAADKAELRAARWDIGIAGIYCYMTAPAHAEHVTVNAGRVDVSVVCKTSDIGSSDTWWIHEASFSFDALTGHDYVITQRRCGACVKLTDETTGELVAEFPALSYSKNSGFRQDLSTGDDTATIMGRSCRFSNGNVSSLIVDAGLISIDVTCTVLSFIPFRAPPRITSRIDFEAEVGHVYLIMDRGGLFGMDYCVTLFDNTSEESIIECAPYETVE